jgi:predicted nucleotidyltransferase
LFGRIRVFRTRMVGGVNRGISDSMGPSFRVRVKDMNRGVQTKREVFETLTNHSVQLKELGVKKVGVFGSFVRNEQTPESDIDLLVQFEPGKKSFDTFMDLSGLLEDLLQRRVEIVTTEALSPYIGPHILSEVEYVSLST